MGEISDEMLSSELGVTSRAKNEWSDFVAL